MRVMGENLRPGNIVLLRSRNTPYTTGQFM